MTVDRKRLRELALAAQRAINAFPAGNREDVGAYRDATTPQTVLELLDALEAAEQPALPMDDARDAARWRYIRSVPQREIDALRFPGNDSLMSFDKLDAAVDAAIAERAAKESK